MKSFYTPNQPRNFIMFNKGTKGEYGLFLYPKLTPNAISQVCHLELEIEKEKWNLSIPPTNPLWIFIM